MPSAIDYPSLFGSDSALFPYLEPSNSGVPIQNPPPFSLLSPVKIFR
jgi:hypothetical protein